MKTINWILKSGLTLLLLTAAFFCPAQSKAAGLLIADGGFGGVLEVKEHDVQVTINNGVAVTKVIQVFRNTESRQVEALYTFPVPRGASVSGFNMWINGREMVGEVLEKKRAREIYESYKQTRQDPGLLEQKDYKTFEMRVFPIGPNADQKVQITYYQELDYDHDWATYVYPLATTTQGKVDTRTTGRFAVNFQVKSAVPIVKIESPSHERDFVMAKHSDHFHEASLEMKSGSLAEDIVLAYQLTRPKTGIDLVTSKAEGEAGYFCMTMTAGEDLAKKDHGMDYVFVVDISGSMADDGKLLLSKDSVSAFINELGPEDRFEVITFNVQPYLAFQGLNTAEAQNKHHAIRFLGLQQARGGTTLNPAMTTAYKYAEADRPLNVLILSDGLTEQAERRTLLQLIQGRPRNARVFCVGVGNDVNRPLLEQMANDSGGLAAFISHGDNFERQAKAFRRKLTRPVASNLSVEFAGVDVFDVEPKQLPNLYHGQPVRIYGRYKSGGSGTVSVRASVNGVEWKESAKLEFPKQDLANPEIDRMWAWHRIDNLLKESDRTGTREQVVDEVIKLGELYSIVTEYTSFLVLENDAEFQRWKIARVNTDRLLRDRKAQEQLQAQLDRIRSKAIADLGPQPQIASADLATQQVQQQPRSSTSGPIVPSHSQATSRQSRNFDLGGSSGSGPVGPLFVLLIMGLAKLKRRLN